MNPKKVRVPMSLEDAENEIVALQGYAKEYSRKCNEIRHHCRELIDGQAVKVLGCNSLKELFEEAFEGVEDHGGLYRLVHAAKVESSLKLSTGTVPESVLREFPEKMRDQWDDIWSEVIENLGDGENPTAKMVRAEKNKRKKQKEKSLLGECSEFQDKLDEDEEEGFDEEGNEDSAEEDPHTTMDEQYQKAIKNLKPTEYKLFIRMLKARHILIKGARIIHFDLPASERKMLIKQLEEHHKELIA